MTNDTTLTVADEKGIAGNSAEFTKQRDGGLLVYVDNPWAGDTETGFGYSCSCNLSKEQVARLIEWLQADDR